MVLYLFVVFKCVYVLLCFPQVCIELLAQQLLRKVVAASPIHGALRSLMQTSPTGQHDKETQHKKCSTHARQNQEFSARSGLQGLQAHPAQQDGKHGQGLKLACIKSHV